MNNQTSGAVFNDQPSPGWSGGDAWQHATPEDGEDESSSFYFDLEPEIDESILREWDLEMGSSKCEFGRVFQEPTISDFFTLQASCAAHNAMYLGSQSIVFQERDDECYVPSEVGDDFIAFTNQPAIAVMESVLATELFGMVISKDDTFLSKKFGNFTEKYVLMPQDRMDLVGITTNVKGGARATPVIDIPPLRATLPVDPQVRSNVNSLEGKMTLFARSLAYSKGGPDELLNWKFSIFQDVLLGVGTQGDKFPYIPAAIGGYDKPIPMCCEANLDRALKWFKRGRYRGLIITILTRANTLINGNDFVRDPFIEHVRSMYEGFDATYVNYKRNMPITKGKVPKEAMGMMLGEFSTNNATNAALRRLRAARVVVSERDLIVANEVEAYVKGLLSSDPSDFKMLKEQAEREYREATTFCNSMNILYNEYVKTKIIPILDRSTIDFSMRLDLDSTIKVRNFLFGERFFTRDALDFIMSKGVSKVEFPLFANGYRVFREQEVGIEATEEQVESLNLLFTWARGEKASLPPRELLEDDDIIKQSLVPIVNEGLNDPGIVQGVVLVTSDKALCRQINDEMGIVVFQLPPYLVKAAQVDLIQTTPALVYYTDEAVLGHFAKRIKERYPVVYNLRSKQIQPHGIVDLGSWKAEMEKLNIFPFEKPKLIIEKRLEYFEYRHEPSMDMLKFYQSQYDAWPSKKEVYDLEGLVTFSKGQGNPQTSKLRQLVGGINGSWRRGSLAPIQRALDSVKARLPKSISKALRPKGREVFTNGVVPEEVFDDLVRNNWV
jgi:hypothetical protein